MVIRNCESFGMRCTNLCMHAKSGIGVTQTLTMRVELLCGRRAVVVFGQLLPNASPVRVIGDGAEGKTAWRGS